MGFILAFIFGALFTILVIGYVLGWWPPVIQFLQSAITVFNAYKNIFSHTIIVKW
jgi:hypothetical protein